MMRLAWHRVVQATNVNGFDIGWNSDRIQCSTLPIRESPTFLTV